MRPAPTTLAALTHRNLRLSALEPTVFADLDRELAFLLLLHLGPRRSSSVVEVQFEERVLSDPAPRIEEGRQGIGPEAPPVQEQPVASLVQRAARR